MTKSNQKQRDNISHLKNVSETVRPELREFHEPLKQSRHDNRLFNKWIEATNVNLRQFYFLIFKKKMSGTMHFLCVSSWISFPMRFITLKRQERKKESATNQPTSNTYRRKSIHPLSLLLMSSSRANKRKEGRRAFSVCFHEYWMSWDKEIINPLTNVSGIKTKLCCCGKKKGFKVTFSIHDFEFVSYLVLMIYWSLWMSSSCQAWIEWNTKGRNFQQRLPPEITSFSNSGRLFCRVTYPFKNLNRFRNQSISELPCWRFSPGNTVDFEEEEKKKKTFSRALNLPSDISGKNCLLRKKPREVLSQKLGKFVRSSPATHWLWSDPQTLLRPTFVVHPVSEAHNLQGQA